MERLLIKNARIATSDTVFEGALLTAGEKIAALYPAEGAPPDAAGAREIDAGGMLLLPGGVDAHTHFDLDLSYTRASDDFYTGSVAAAIGGTTTIIDHLAFGPSGCALGHQPKVYHHLAQDAVIDYGFHGVIQHVNDEVLRDMQALRDEEGICSFKAYLTYDYRLDDAALLQVLRRAAELGVVICVHCENHAAITALCEEFVRRGDTAARFHPLSRPAEAEAEAVFRVLMLARMAGNAPVYIVHLSSAAGAAALRLARQGGAQNTWAETCPQYLLLDDTLYDAPADGLKAIMSPPLRKATDQQALWHAMEQGEIDTIGTDHCPFFFETQKQRGRDNFTRCPGGIPGVELRMALLYSEGVHRGRISLPRYVQLCCQQPAALFGLAGRKGDIAPGYDADLLLFDPQHSWRVRKELLHERVDYSPYEGMELSCRPVMTISSGEIIAENGELHAQKGRGRYLSRKLGRWQAETAGAPSNKEEMV